MGLIIAFGTVGIIVCILSFIFSKHGKNISCYIAYYWINNVYFIGYDDILNGYIHVPIFSYNRNTTVGINEKFI